MNLKRIILGGNEMDKLEIVKLLLDNNIMNWEKAEKESKDKSYYSGIVAGLRGFRQQIDDFFK